ncbi:unnamed protein product [Boreogadus saida]
MPSSLMTEGCHKATRGTAAEERPQRLHPLLPTEVRADGGKHRPDRVETGGACCGLKPLDATELVRALGGLRHGHRKAKRGEAGVVAPSSSRSESSDSELTRRERGTVERDSKVVDPFSNGGGSVGSVLSVVHRQRSIMPTQAERRERQDGMFMPKAALRVTCLADAVRR